MDVLVGSKSKPLATGYTHQRLLAGDMMYSREGPLRKNGINVFGCLQRWAKGCKAKLWVDETSLTIKRTKNEHSCGQVSNADRAQAAILKSKIRKEAVQSPATPVSVILGQKAKGVPKSALGQLKTESVKRQMRKVRTRELGLPSPPADLSFEIPPHLVEAELGGDEAESFLLWDSGAAEGRPRILIFGWKEGLQLLHSCDLFFADGTFFSTPGVFKKPGGRGQTFIISAWKVNSGRAKAVPCIWALMNQAKLTDYVAIWEKVAAAVENETGAPWKPKKLISDFERSIWASFLNVFGSDEEVEVAGCWFHLRKAARSRRKDLIPDAVYAARKDIQMGFKAFLGLAFLPSEQVKEAGNRLLFQRNPDSGALLHIPDELAAFGRGFIRDYVGLEWPGQGSHKPLYQPSFWNLYRPIQTGSPRTDNPSEGINHRMITVMGPSPSLWIWLTKLPSMIGLSRATIAEGSAAGPAPPKAPALRLSRADAPGGEWTPKAPATYNELVAQWSHYRTDPIKYIKTAATLLP